MSIVGRDGLCRTSMGRRTQLGVTLLVLGKLLAKTVHLSKQSRMLQVTISNAANTDPSHLAEIRANAMKPSLKAVGRFDEERVRKRFLDAYNPADTHVVRAGQDLIGFYVLRKRPDHLHLSHLYISPTHQGGGLGRRIVRAVQDQARDTALPVRLMALRGSPANGFYTSCGFVLERSDDLDNYYIWEPA